MSALRSHNFGFMSSLNTIEVFNCFTISIPWGSTGNYLWTYSSLLSYLLFGAILLNVYLCLRHAIYSKYRFTIHIFAFFSKRTRLNSSPFSLFQDSYIYMGEFLCFFSAFIASDVRIQHYLYIMNVVYNLFVPSGLCAIRLANFRSPLRRQLI